MRIAINGFGRIGRTFLRTLLLDDKARKQIEVAVINVGPSNPADCAYFFQYDSIMGIYPHGAEYRDGCLYVQGLTIPVIACKDAAQLPWKKYAIDWVVDCSGKYTHRKDAELHIKAGAAKVLISAPAHDVDCTIVPGVNAQAYNKDKDSIVSLGSCTTNALMPLLKVVSENWGIESALVTSTHAYTPSQALLDGFDGDDVRRGRAAALNIVPASTGADRMIAEIFPHLKGKIMANALRVPVPKVSLVDVTWVCKKPLTRDEINAVVSKVAQNELKTIMQMCPEPLVSSDFAGNPHSVIVDGNLTNAVGSMGKVCGWYDNEWGYSCRLKDFLMTIA